MPNNINNAMSKITLTKLSKNHPIAFWMAIILHIGLLLGLIFANIEQWDIQQQTVKKTKSKPAPKAITIDLSDLEKQTQKKYNTYLISKRKNS